MLPPSFGTAAIHAVGWSPKRNFARPHEVSCPSNYSWSECLSWTQVPDIWTRALILKLLDISMHLLHIKQHSEF